MRTLAKQRIALLTLTAIGSLLVYGLLLVIGAAIAHADPAPGTLPETGGGHDWAFYAALGLAALAGVRAIVTTSLEFFVWLAPRTRTTVDDSIRNDLQLAHDKLDALAGLVGTLMPNAKPQAVSGTIGGAA